MEPEERIIERGREKGRIFEAALRAQQQRRDETRRKKTKRKVRSKPWDALRESWLRFINAKYGPQLLLRPWNQAERNCAKLLVDTYGMAKAEQMSERFIDDWKRDELPPISYLWAARDTVAAKLSGTISRAGGVKRGEYSEENERESPKLGW